MSSRNAEFLHNEVPGIHIPDTVRKRIRGLEGEEGRKQGIEIAKELIKEILRYNRSIYTITPFGRHEISEELTRFVREYEQATASSSKNNVG